MSSLKEGMLVAVEEYSLHEKNKPQEDVMSRNLRKERTVIHQ
jgi:hypothetical protein